VFAQRYDRKAGIGTVLALMVPYSVTFFICWTLLLIVWIFARLPLGPGAGLHYAPLTQ
jgi:aminobenzoyl-glutamate transport protein